MEKAGFRPCSKEELEELEKIPLSKEKVEKLDSVLVQLSLSAEKVSGMQLAIERAQLTVPAFSYRLNRMKWLLDGEIRMVSDCKAKVGESPSLVCDMALSMLEEMNGTLLFITQECDFYVVDSDGAVATAGFSPEAISKMISNKFGT